jgi:hypothetical protein
MASSLDLDAISESFCVKTEVIEILFNFLPFRDMFDQITSATTCEEFWDFIDSLPRHISMRIHACQARLETTSKDFPAETLSPVLELFWAANLLSQNKTPTTINARAITQVYPEHICKFLTELGHWEQVSESEWRFGEVIFSMNSLVLMCDTFLSNGRTWIFCDIPDLRISYFIFAEQIRSLGDQFAYLKARTLNKLRCFGYFSSDQMLDDIKDAGTLEIPRFEMPSEVSAALSALMKKSMTVWSLPPKSPEIGPINDWVRTRSEALVIQMALPLQQRSAFILTPQVLQARMGQNPEAPFEPFSITELLFSNSDGEAAPMPYSSCKVELPSGSPIKYCRSVFRRFVARQLLAFGYEVASDPVLDILADVVGNEVKKIAQTAVTIQQGTQAEPELCLVHALEVCGYDSPM